VLEGFLGGAIKFTELAAISSDPGAKAQAVHADTMHGVTRFLQSDVDIGHSEPLPEDATDEDRQEVAEDVASVIRTVATDTALLTSALVALQDVEEDMGPTHVWPGTNTVAHHATLWDSGVGGKLKVEDADEKFGVKHLKMTLKKGDLVLYDSRTMHCGGANTSDGKRRSVLVISTMGPGVRPDGSTCSMLPHLRKRGLRLVDFPMNLDLVDAPTAVPGEPVVLPPQTAAALLREGDLADADSEQPREIPPLDDWAAAVQCTTCRQWRAVTVAEAPKFANAEMGFYCKQAGYICTQPQVYSNEDIDAALA